LARDPNIELIGAVPDVRRHFQAASVVVVPLRIARGIQNKVLEALAVGKPVIASPQALEGLDVVAGEHVHEANTTKEWIDAISFLFKDRSARCRLGAAGRAFVLHHHQWNKCLRPFGELLGLTPLSHSEPSDAAARLAIHAQ
jgi:glycosyltransferase involved in cell wall biosynthesis